MAAGTRRFKLKRGELLPAHLYLRHLLNNTIAVLFFMAAALGIGVAGYMHFEGMSLVDGFANAAMILSGMGPLTALHTEGGKIFAGCYALFSGIFFIFATAVLLTPIARRVLHQFHLDYDAAE